MSETNIYDIVIVGSGMAGLSAGLYAGRYELKTLVIGHEFGGATSTAWTIENYPGYKSIDGYELMMKVKEQVEALGVEVLNDKVTNIEKSESGFTLTTFGDKTLTARTLVMAHGAARRKLGLPREEEFAKGKGVHYCTTCDGPLYKGKVIGVVGGGDASVKGLNLAVQYAEKIYLFVREDKLIAEPINYARLKPYLGNKVEVMYKTEVKELLGESRLTGVKLANDQTVELSGLFVEIGAVPETELIEKLGVAVDDHKYISVNNMMETNVEGVFAAGDCTNFFGHFKQDVTAAAMGSVAATSAFNFIQKPQ